MRLKGFVPFVGALVVCCFSGGSLANTPPGAVEFIRRAQVVVDGKDPNAPLMPGSDPRMQALLQVSSGRTVFGTAPSSAQDLAWVLKVKLPLAGLIQRYLADGVAAGTDPTSAQTMANSDKYADVVYPLVILTMYAGAHELSALADWLPSQPEPKRTTVLAEALAVRKGAIAMVTGLLMASPGAGELGKRRGAMLMAFADSAPALAAALTLRQRKELYFRIVTMPSPGNPSEQAEYSQFEQAFKSTDCSGLCAYND